MSIFDSFPSQDVIKEYASTTIGIALAVWASWQIHYSKAKERVRLANSNKPVAPMPIPEPQSPSPAPPSLPTNLPTLSPGLAARVAQLELEKQLRENERRAIEETVQRERTLWGLEEQIRRLKKDLEDKNEDCDKTARELTRVRSENDSLQADCESKDRRIERLKRRLAESGPPRGNKPT